MGSPFDIAFKYHTLGRCTIPSGGGPSGKGALVPWAEFQSRKPTDPEVQDWEERLRPRVWAMVTGKVSGCFVIDCDSPEAVAMMAAAGLQPHVKTPRGGSHYYCALPSFPVPTKAGILPKVDVRGEGGYANFCGGNLSGQL